MPTPVNKDTLLDRASRSFNTVHLHYAPTDAPCKFTVGPRGGQTLDITNVRQSGGVKTWRSPKNAHRFEMPIKYGMYTSFVVHEGNAADYHFPEDCPAVEAQAVYQRTMLRGIQS